MHWLRNDRRGNRGRSAAQLAAATPAAGRLLLAIIYLTGDLGAEKPPSRAASCARCGVSGPVKSPTYTLVEVYETPTVTVVHLDLYRLLDPERARAPGSARIRARRATSGSSNGRSGAPAGCRSRICL